MECLLAITLLFSHSVATLIVTNLKIVFTRCITQVTWRSGQLDDESRLVCTPA